MMNKPHIDYFDGVWFVDYSKYKYEYKKCGTWYTIQEAWQDYIEKKEKASTEACQGV